MRCVVSTVWCIGTSGAVPYVLRALVFSDVVSLVVWTRSPIDIDCPCLALSQIQWNPVSKHLDFFWRTLLCTITCAVELSVLRGVPVLCCLWPIKVTKHGKKRTIPPHTELYTTMYARKNQDALTRDSIGSVIEPNKDNSMYIGDRVQTTRLTTSPSTMRLPYIKHSARRTYMPNRTHNTSHPTSLV